MQSVFNRRNRQKKMHESNEKKEQELLELEQDQGIVSTEKIKFDNQELRNQILQDSEEFEMRSKKLKEQIATLDKDLEFTKNMFSSKNETLTKKIEAQNLEIKELESVNSTQPDNQLYVKNKILKQEYDQIQNDIDTDIKTCSKFNEKIEFLQYQINESKFLMEAIPIENEEVFEITRKRILHDNEQCIMNQQMNVYTYECQKQELMNDISIYETLIEGLKEENSYFIAKNQKMEKFITKLRSEVKSLKSKRKDECELIPRSEMETEIDGIKKNAQEKKRSLKKKYQPQIKELEKSNQDLQYELDKKNESIDELSKQITILTEQYNSIQT